MNIYLLSTLVIIFITVSLLNIEKSNSDFLKDWLIRLLLII